MATRDATAGRDGVGKLSDEDLEALREHLDREVGRRAGRGLGGGGVAVCSADSPMES